MGGIGVPELAVVLLIVLVIFGPKRLPQLGKQLGSGMREFKDSITGRHEDEDDDAHAALGRPELTHSEPHVETVQAEPHVETVQAEPVRDDAPASRDSQ